MKKTKVDLTQEDIVEVPVPLINKLVSDLTGLAEWDVKNAPLAIWDLAEHLISYGWKK